MLQVLMTHAHPLRFVDQLDDRGKMVSVLAPGWLLDGSGLAAGVCGFAGMWWGVRLGLHVRGFETKGLADDGWKRWAKHGLGWLFLMLTMVYVWALVWNLTGGGS